MYKDRYEAGKQLAKQLVPVAGENTIVLALPRGGVEVGYEVAKRLGLPLEVIIARKLGAPENPEFGIGAISENGAFFLDRPTVELLGLTSNEIDLIKYSESREVSRRIALYRNGNPLPNLENKTIVLVDDGLATGVTALAAIISIKFNRPKKIIFATPVCAYESAETVSKEVDYIICLQKPFDMKAIGMYYQNFGQVSDKTVIQILRKSQEDRYTKHAKINGNRYAL